MTDLDLTELNEKFKAATTGEILRWTWETFGEEAALSSSFQTQSVPLLHLVSRCCPGLPVLFLDTGFHFPETLAFRDELVEQLGLNLIVVEPEIQKSELIAQYGEGLYRRDPDLCCYINKVKPMQQAIKNYRAWLSGVRRDQTAHRRSLSIFEQPDAQKPLKIHPMLTWTQQDIWRYSNAHNLPDHPLLKHGYFSVGCAPCTRPVFDGEDPRAGRWAGNNKNECGLHLNVGVATSEESYATNE